VRVLLVDDDDHVADAVCFALRQHGHEAVRAATGAEALSACRDVEFVLLDLGLPDLDGTEVCRRIRETSTVPVIVVSARSDEIDRVLGLQLGADDYLVKPFGVRELLARMQAVSRRSSPVATEPLRAATAYTIVVGPLEIDARGRQAVLAGDPLPLTRKEFDLLLMLAEEPGVVHTREAIVERVWDEHWFGSTRTLDVHVGTLRTKLGGRGWVQTVRGVGFRLQPPTAAYG